MTLLFLGRYRNRVEFKGILQLVYGRRTRVDIETEWNLKTGTGVIKLSDSAVDIETEWNLKRFPVQLYPGRQLVDIETEWNLKKLPKYRSKDGKFVDIETEWNLKDIVAALASRARE